MRHNVHRLATPYAVEVTPKSQNFPDPGEGLKGYNMRKKSFEMRFLRVLGQSWLIF